MRGHSWLLSQVMDAKVKDAQGDDLGQIKDVVLDPASGRPSFAVIQLNGQVGPKGDYAPVPWALLNLPATSAQTGQPKTVFLNVNRDRFASAQKFFLHQWPDSNQASWGPQLYSYYGLDYGSLGMSAGATGTGFEPAIGMGSDYYRTGMGRYGPTRANGMPIDNGTAPDGKGTFVHGLRY
jgi:sporulation protein YlmC with PRC-barrel domain